MSRRPHAFTIVELLVSISIIALLMGILLPAISQARSLSKRTLCASRLREVGAAAFFYLESDKFFPPLNNDPMDGHWQYNYLIWDGRDYEENFGPFVTRNLFPELQVLYCPTQASPFHQLNTLDNPWPPKPGQDARAAYGRRPLITGLDVTQVPAGTALYADLFHTPRYVLENHAAGMNVIFADSHVRFVPVFSKLIHNDMMLPTSLIDNPTMMHLWQDLDTKE